MCCQWDHRLDIEELEIESRPRGRVVLNEKNKKLTIKQTVKNGLGQYISPGIFTVKKLSNIPSGDTMAVPIPAYMRHSTISNVSKRKDRLNQEY